jgi:hypothetical protein
LSLQEKTRYWMYIAVGDERTCSACEGFSGGIFTSAEVSSLFPDVLEQDDELWLPQFHSGCRCMLVGKAEDWGPDMLSVTGPPTEEPADENPFDVSLWGLERAPHVHDDYWRIRRAFMKLYGPQQGGKEFLQWLRLNRLSPHHPYGRRYNPKQEHKS